MTTEGAAEKPVVQVYDTTLRDGMQQEGMSVSVEEKARIALKLDELGLHFIEGGFPASNPKEAAFFAPHGARASRARRARRLRHDAAQGRRRPTTTATCACWPRSSRRRSRIVGKTWDLHLDQGPPREPRREPAHDRRLRRLSGRARASAWSTTPSTSSTPGATTRRTPCSCVRAAAEAGAERRLPVRHERRHRCRRRRRRGPRGRRRRRRRRRSWASTSTTTPTAPWPTRLGAVEAGARHVQGTMNGYGERCGNANLVSIVPALQLKMGYRVVSDEQLAALTETAHFVDEWPTSPSAPTRPTSGATPSPTRAACTSPPSTQTPQTFEHVDPAAVGNEQRVLISELSGKGAVLRKAQELGVPLESDDERVARGAAHAQGARAPRLPLRGRRRLVRPAAARGGWRRTSRSSVSRASACSSRSARTGARSDRGDDQDPGRRRALDQHRRGQRPRQRPRPGAAPGDRRASTRTSPTSSSSTTRSASSTRPRAPAP